MKLSPLHGIYSLLLGWNTDQRKAWKSLVKLKIPMIQKLSSLILLGWCKSNYLNSLKITSCEMPDWMNHKLESRLLGEMIDFIWEITSQIYRWYHSNGRKWRGTKEPPDEGERGEWRSWLKTQHSENLRSWHLVPSLHGK